MLAHELSHTRQHTWLGPVYLPVHVVCQIVSVLASLVRPIPTFSRLHAYNPLERIFLSVPFDVLVDPTGISESERERIWCAFGLAAHTS